MRALFAHIPLDAFHARLHDLVHERGEVGEHVQRGAEVFAQLGRFRDRVGEDGPDPRDEEPTGHGCQAVRCEQVGWVGGLSVGFGEGDAEDLDLQFVADDQDGADDAEDCLRKG